MTTEVTRTASLSLSSARPESKAGASPASIGTHAGRTVAWDANWDHTKTGLRAWGGAKSREFIDIQLDLLELEHSLGEWTDERITGLRERIARLPSGADTYKKGLQTYLDQLRRSASETAPARASTRHDSVPAAKAPSAGTGGSLRNMWQQLTRSAAGREPRAAASRASDAKGPPARAAGAAGGPSEASQSFWSQPFSWLKRSAPVRQTDTAPARGRPAEAAAPAEGSLEQLAHSVALATTIARTAAREAGAAAMDLRRGPAGGDDAAKKATALAAARTAEEAAMAATAALAKLPPDKIKTQGRVVDDARAAIGAAHLAAKQARSAAGEVAPGDMKGATALHSRPVAAAAMPALERVAEEPAVSEARPAGAQG